MSPKRIAAAAGVVVGLLVLGACGVPSDGPATRVQHVPQDESKQDSSDGMRPLLPSQDAINTVDSFLGSAAGDWSGRDKRLNLFTKHPAKWSDPAEGVQLIRVPSTGIKIVGHGTTTRTKVEVTGKIVGLYTPSGQVKPWSGDDDFTQTYTLTRDSHPEVWSISNPPKQVALQDDVFSERYEPSPLYFPASSDNAGTLVPDLRWMPMEVTDREARDTQVVDWLMGGPSEWVGSTVSSAFPEGTSRKSVTVSKNGKRVTVELSMESAAQPSRDAGDMSAQLAWSLGLHGSQTLRLVVDGRNREVAKASKWAGRNHAPRADKLKQNLAYFIKDNGTVWSSDADDPFFEKKVPGLTNAALEPRGDRIAGVVGGHLVVGASDKVDRVPKFSSGDLRDPQWLDSRTLLVLADGTPTTVDIASGESHELSPRQVDGTITHIDLAPDGRRLAFVAGGHAWVATMLPGEKSVSKMASPRRVGNDISEVRDVSWSRETHLMLIGTVADALDWLWEVSIDDAYQVSPKGENGKDRASTLAVRCAPALNPDNAYGQPVLFNVDGSINRLYSNELAEVKFPDGKGGQYLASGVAPFVAP
ncbi:MAG TPA: LpqB family beta-propeller domain-containing protein [Stackebrandtia sp.]|jgi:hypothetical protein|uniref:LpqB family beta-propeller domain-containing protein n=1 Tax=Stackebrandtia sp. TaxID=2023065 RepID=UPI002D2B76E9|nr:LpqB family beta-propeller domain-containing protein [Stackebrandtia sp.]HZE39590.1 LpqB family beta-propeller domain-containing protein [Stackebrandtia sp.]